MTDLKNCPFCGAKPYYGGFPDVRIECQQCKQSMIKASWYEGDLGTMEASWQKRHESAKTPVRVDLERCAMALYEATPQSFSWLESSEGMRTIIRTKAKAVIDELKAQGVEVEA